MIYKTKGRRVFNVINGIVIVALTVSCVMPVWTMFCYSLSSSGAVSSGQVSLWPVDFTLAPYQFVMTNDRFWQAFLTTLQRLALGVPLTMLVVILAAYPLSKSTSVFRARKFYMYFFLIPMLFSGGLIPNYILIYNLKLMDSIWALILPGLVPIGNVVLLMNFFRSIPGEIEEAALIDGAGYWRVLRRIVLPLSVPALATICLFVLLGHWNAWFDGLLYMNRQEGYPLQSYLQTLLIDSRKLMVLTGNVQDMVARSKVSGQNLRAAQIFISMVPILCVYPFMQRYFTTGLVMGSVKG